MATALASKPGLTGATALSIPKDWDATWFRNFISNMLKGADVRNAVGANGITVSGTIASPYATISIGGSGPVTIPAPLTIGPPTGTNVTTVTVDVGATTAYKSGFIIIAPNTTDQSNGLTVKAGTSSNDANLVLQNAAGTYNYFALLGDGSWSFNRSVAVQTLVQSAAGNITINAPSSGNTLSVAATNGLANYAGIFTSGNAGTACKFVGRAAGTPGVEFTTMASTGAAAPTLGANKPGGASSVATWLVVTVDGNTRYIPCWS